MTMYISKWWKWDPAGWPVVTFRSDATRQRLKAQWKWYRRTLPMSRHLCCWSISAKSERQQRRHPADDAQAVATEHRQRIKSP
jgi:hypothetical protein